MTGPGSLLGNTLTFKTVLLDITGVVVMNLFMGKGPGSLLEKCFEEDITLLDTTSIELFLGGQFESDLELVVFKGAWSLTLGQLLRLVTGVDFKINFFETEVFLFSLVSLKEVEL